MQLGLRFERQVTETEDPDLPSRAFFLVSIAGGLVFERFEGWRMGLTINRTERGPTAEELYSAGPHAATRAFEQGDAGLGREVATGVELTGDFELLHGERHHLHLELGYDHVRAELRDRDEYLPRTPPRRLRGGLVYLGERARARCELRWVDRARRVAPLEEPTAGYTMLDASYGWRFFGGKRCRSCWSGGPTSLTRQPSTTCHSSRRKHRCPGGT